MFNSLSSLVLLSLFSSAVLGVVRWDVHRWVLVASTDDRVSGMSCPQWNGEKIPTADTGALCILVVVGSGGCRCYFPWFFF